MDIALKTLVLIIFILIPGFLFRKIYFQGTFSKQFDSKSWSHSLFYSVLFGLILNFVAYNYYEYLFLKIDYSTCLHFYNSITKDTINEKDIEAFEIVSVYKYLAVLYGTAIIISWVLYLVVRNFKLDRRFESLRFANNWHYYFKGEIKDFKEFSLSKGKCSVVTVDVLVKSEKDGSNLYSGLLTSYLLDGNGVLESISLTQAQIFKKEQRVFKDIHSTVLIIPNSTILNINLRYTFEQEDDTVIDFIDTTIYILLLIFFWIDFKNIFTDYNLASKILLKIFISFNSIFIPLTIDSLYRYLIFDAKPKRIPQNATAENRRQIELSNESQKKSKLKLKRDIINSAILGIIFFGILIAILYFTK